MLQSSGTDSAVNLWLASSASRDQLTSERLFFFFYHGCFPLISLLWLDLTSTVFFFFNLIFCRLVDSPTRRVDPLLNSYSDYEDSVYGNKVQHSDFLVFDFDFKLTFLLQNFRPCLEFPWTLDLCFIILWWQGKNSWVYGVEKQIN